MALVFTVNTVAWRIGMIIAPFIGGVLAEPATYYPGVFEGTIWERYPYALSGVVVSNDSAPRICTGEQQNNKADLSYACLFVIGSFHAPPGSCSRHIHRSRDIAEAPQEIFLVDIQK